MIYVFLANGFEEIEAVTVIDILRRAELEVQTIGVGTKTPTGSHGIQIHADLSEEEASFVNLEMMVLPGGMPGTLNLEKSRIVQSFLDFCAENKKYIAAICAAPSILGKRGLLRGKKASCYMGFEDFLEGAILSQDAVCVSDRIITSRGAGTAMDFGLALVSLLCGEERSRLLADAMVYQGYKNE